jgi:hypothetical protein
MMKRVALLICIFVLCQSIGAQGPGPVPTASIRGILTKWGGNEGISQAIIELRNGEGAPVSITATRESGEFVFSNVPYGNYGLVAIAPGFALAEYGQLRPGGSGKPLVVTAGVQANVQIQAVPGGSISGRVTNETGQPMVYSEIQILKATYGVEGKLIPAFIQSVTTNDLGDYRAFGLAPGQYLVRAGDSQLNSFVNLGMNNPIGSEATIPSTMVSQTNRPRAAAAPNSNADRSTVPLLSYFYSGAADAATATPVNLTVGGETTGVDIRVAPINFSAQRVKVSGVVVDLAGRPLEAFSNVTIAKWPTSVATAYTSARILTAGEPSTNPGIPPGALRYVIDKGKFEVSVEPGKYQIRASQGELSGRAIMDIGSRDVSLTIPLQPSATVTGRIRFESEPAGTPHDWSKLQIGVWTGPAFSFLSPISANGQFRIEHVIAGDYQFVMPPWTNAPVSPTDRRGFAISTPPPDRSTMPSVLENAYLKSIRAADVDYMENPLRIEGGERVESIEIVVSLNAASFDGRVLNAKREPVDRATVVLFPKSAAFALSDRYRTNTTDASGRFQFHGIPPGEYRVFAWEDVDAGAWFNPAMLAAYERNATSLTFAEKQQQHLDLDVIPVEAVR